MKRSGNRGGHAAMLALQPLKGFQRLGIAQDAGDLPTTGGVGGLAQGAGLGLVHSGAGRRAQRNKATLFLAQLRMVGRSPSRTEAVGAGRAQVDGAEAAVLREGERRHFGLRVGPIPTMWPSYRVTSDMSMTVCREAA